MLSLIHICIVNSNKNLPEYNNAMGILMLMKGDYELSKKYLKVAEPVSYTHLDVYKRQVLKYIISFSPFSGQQDMNSFLSFRILMQAFPRTCLLYTSAVRVTSVC